VPWFQIHGTTEAADVTEATIARGIGEKLASLGASPLNVDVTVVPRIDGGRDSAGKFKVIESNTGMSTPIQRTMR
jgi:hypothetical protein